MSELYVKTGKQYTPCAKPSSWDRDIDIYRPATPAEIEAAHPKCRTCDYFNPECDTTDCYGEHTTIAVCTWEGKLLYSQVHENFYCPYHSELYVPDDIYQESEQSSEDGYDDWGESDFDVDPDFGAK